MSQTGERQGWSRTSAVSAAVLLAAVAAIYAPSVGAGFIRDDFAWIRTSAIHSPRDAVETFRRSNGFYRPLVALSFGVNRFAGLEPSWYGLANLGLLFGCLAAAIRLFRRIGLGSGAAVFAAGLWALNFHGINMAVLWISGRTALLLILFAILAADAAVGDRWWIAAAWTFCALLSKEEAVMLPAMLLAWRRLASDERGARVWGRRVAIAAVPLGAYLILRAGSGAMTPLDAPAEYRFTTDAARLARNGLEYADRAATLPALATIAAMALAGRAGLAWRPRGHARTLVTMGLVWVIGGYALTIWVPVRSSLYACFPSIGVALIAAVVCGAAYDAMPPARRKVATAGALALPFLLWPLYHARNASYDEMGAFSRSVLRDLRAVPDGTRVVIADGPDRPNIAGTFGDLLPDALDVFAIRVQVCVEPGADCQAADRGGAVVRFRVRDGRLIVPE
jgi:hypothetical protein